MKYFFSIISGLLLATFSLASCGLFSEGDPVAPKEGITAKWQSDINPGRIMTFKDGGQGHYENSEQGIDQDFKYSFTDDDTIKVNFKNGQSMNMDIKTTTLYMWVTNEQGTERFHKYE